MQFGREFYNVIRLNRRVACCRLCVCVCAVDTPKVFRIEMFVLKHTPTHALTQLCISHGTHTEPTRMSCVQAAPKPPPSPPAAPNSPNVMITIKSITSKTLINTTFICKIHYRRAGTPACTYSHGHTCRTGAPPERQRMQACTQVCN